MYSLFYAEEVGDQGAFIMAITLRVIGIFFSRQVDLPGGGTVKAVLEAAQSTITAGMPFRYETELKDGVESPTSFRVFREGSFQSPASGYTYPSGTYKLEENLKPDPVTKAYTVWQYYLTDANGVFINKDKGFIAYDDPERAHVEDGWTVTWRLVSVLASPVDPAPRLGIV